MTTSDATQGEAPVAPVIRILHGNPTPEQVGALVAVLSAVSGGGDASLGGPTSHWSAPADRLGQRSPGRDAWRFSTMPV